MHGFVGKSDGDFGACEVMQALRLSRCGCAVLAADFVVVSQCPQFNAIDFGALGKGFGGEGTVRHYAVAVQIGVQNGGERHRRDFTASGMSCKLARILRQFARSPSWGLYFFVEVNICAV
jgi:hypothetical protein